MDFDLSTFGKVSNRDPSRAFPLLVEAYRIGDGFDSAIGRDMSVPDQPTVTVYLRPRKKDEDADKNGYSRPEIINFASDVIGDAMRSGDRAEVDRALNNPLAKVYTEPGGVILVDGAYLDDKTGFYSASWLRSLSKTAGAADVESPVWARINEPYQREASSRLTASVDVVYPESRVVAESFDDLQQFAVDIIGRKSGGDSFAVIRLESMNQGTSFARIIKATRQADDHNNYTWEDPQAVLQRFWDSFGENWLPGLKAALDSKQVNVQIYPGVRYHFVGKGLETVAKRGDDHSAKFRMNEGEENGFMKCTVVTKEHDGGNGEMFPIGCFPLLPFDDRPRSLNIL